ncbi:ferrous iron transport protein B [Luxibacter massiliensis]|uniref:ferrous iron transport protein B n=1 Tax=Luxibacter massiliensis TaxID=2219695 RepID=UPI000F04781A|nr:ferrous iron transport protein B [Luxibacter massiliensis]
MAEQKIIAVAGNPNVGKSTVFNSLTNLHQHTGNWPGKTVTNAEGFFSTESYSYKVVDIPGTYSLLAHSADEEAARDFICFGGADAVLVVCDATCLERNMNLALQTMEITDKVILCINLLDEAEKKGIHISLDTLSESLGVPVVGMIAREGKGLDSLKDTLDIMMEKAGKRSGSRGNRSSIGRGGYLVTYSKVVEEAISVLEPEVQRVLENAGNPYCLPSRWAALRLLEDDRSFLDGICRSMDLDIQNEPHIEDAAKRAKEVLLINAVGKKELEEEIVSAVMGRAEEMCRLAVSFERARPDFRDRKIDQILTGKRLGYPLMAFLLMVILWITITGANYPSQILSTALFWVQDRLTDLFRYLQAPVWLHDMLVLGVYRVLAWVVSVMLPPMAIFFPLFTLLEDVGYLPRIAYNLDKPFCKCHACGKQALTMAMGFGCNAAGVTGCRIIDSPRERLIAILTNSFVPCNGRFPILIALITMFFVGGGVLSSLTSAVILTAFILLGIGMTFLVSWILSRTVLKGCPSSFTLELPPYRRPQIGKVIVRSIFDRTLFVLGRAVVAAAPAGLAIWAAANIYVGQQSLLSYGASLLDPFARLLGLDGVILIAFILGLPANEIVVPIMVMAYMARGSIGDLNNLTEMKTLFVNNGWTWVTAVCTMLFSLMHWPCSTTLLTIKKETKSWKWTLAALIIPVLAGMVVCFLTAQIAGAFERLI